MTEFKLDKSFAVTVLFSFAFGLLGAAVAITYLGEQSPSSVNSIRLPSTYFVEESDSVSAIEKVTPAVVSIVSTKDLQVFRNQPLDPFFFFNQDPFSPFKIPNQQEPETQRQRISGGTGFIIQNDGLTLTNKHVVSDTKADFTAITKDGKEYDIEVISLDPINDLAIIQLHEKTQDDEERKTGDKKNFGAKPNDLPYAVLGNSTDLKVGQKVFAIGNARGEYSNSVTAGIISAFGRKIEAGSARGGQLETLSGLIQTDAAINFGNSGGPLINMAGEVIGINTAIDASANGVGFAIPVNQITPILESVKQFGRIVRPWLGVMHIILNKEKAEELKLTGVTNGALITGDRSKKEFGVATGSPAEKAGLKMDDVILSVDNEQVTEMHTLQSMIQKHAPGDKIKLNVWRDGKTFDATVTLEERKE